jgi:hypothetical protein
MRITKSQLKQLIKEELQKVFLEEANERKGNPWTVPLEWRGRDRSDQKNLQKLRSGAWGGNWKVAFDFKSQWVSDRQFLLTYLSYGLSIKKCRDNPCKPWSVIRRGQVLIDLKD